MIPDTLCWLVAWLIGVKVVAFPFLSFLVLGENKLFLEKRNRIGLNRKFSVSLQDNDIHKP